MKGNNQQDLFALAYISNSIYKDEADLKKANDDIIYTCDLKNKITGVTGLLYFSHGVYLQYLEGEEINVLETFKKISKDHRHSDITLIYSGRTSARKFEKWAMRFVSNRHYVDNLFQQITHFGFAKGQLNPNNKHLLETFLKMI
ncbi:BLUF domain-containing protein [Marinicella sp. S1101]|uniref:BLUF domain-containing protein n=1 Tax=Marinicella marina TaxID=2996016 RepID=UPI002260CE53|nr:BLUF domain-containing protein [Marinicella marina]MCX7552355.1 BLUF domain-containing protein [Marinicella marina]MDJ1139230.1 BLUF domain-containing protein [Marinicella marina]